MYLEEENAPYRQYPKVPIERRAYAFLLDFVAVWLISSFFRGFIQAFVFMVAWFAIRVVLVEKNKGQSLGRWAYDMRILDLRFNATPTLVNLTKREGMIGICALLAMLGLNINFRNPLSMLLLVTPLFIDCVSALGDEELNQAFHDRWSNTIIIQARRGFSLDIRTRKLWYTIKRQIQQHRQR